MLGRGELHRLLGDVSSRIPNQVSPRRNRHGRSRDRPQSRTDHPICAAPNAGYARSSRRGTTTPRRRGTIDRRRVGSPRSPRRRPLTRLLVDHDEQVELTRTTDARLPTPTPRTQPRSEMMRRLRRTSGCGRPDRTTADATLWTIGASVPRLNERIARRPVNGANCRHTSDAPLRTPDSMRIVMLRLKTAGDNVNGYWHASAAAPV